jgi:hypothetical protein
MEPVAWWTLVEVVLLPPLIALGLFQIAWTAAVLLKPLSEDRCGKCGYSTIGLPTCICPECGSDVRYHRVRRRAWFQFVLLLLLSSSWTVLVVHVLWRCEAYLVPAWVHFSRTYDIVYNDWQSSGEAELVVEVDEWQEIWSGSYLTANATAATVRRRDGLLLVGGLRVSLPDLRLESGESLDAEVLRRWWEGQGVDADEKFVARELVAVREFLEANATSLPRLRQSSFATWHVSPTGSAGQMPGLSAYFIMAAITAAIGWCLGITVLGMVQRSLARRRRDARTATALGR